MEPLLAGRRSSLSMSMMPEEEEDEEYIYIPVAWRRPPRGCYGLNTDASFCDQRKEASVGGVIRSSEGSVVYAFAAKLRAESILEAEALGMLFGLRMARDNNYSGLLLVQTDSLDLIRTLIESKTGRPRRLTKSLAVAVQLIEDVLSPQDRVMHAFRETNRVADCLASYAKKLNTLEMWRSSDLSCFPPELHFWIRHDASGLPVPRFYIRRQ